MARKGHQITHLYSYRYLSFSILAPCRWMGFSGHTSLVWQLYGGGHFIFDPDSICSRKQIFSSGKKLNKEKIYCITGVKLHPTQFFIYDFNKCFQMKLAWQWADPNCNDAQCVGTLTTSSVCDTRGLRVTGEPARHLINSWTSSSRDTYQLLVAVRHQCNDKPFNTTSGFTTNMLSVFFIFSIVVFSI